MVAPEAVVRRIALICVLSMVPIALASRPQSPVLATLSALVLMTGVCLLLERLPEDTNARSAAVVALAVLGNQLAYFFGPSSAFAAVMALLLAITGLLSATQSPRRVRTGWLVLAAICLGHLAIVALVAYGVIADRSLAPIVTRLGQTPRQIIAAHLAVQAVFITAFAAGRAAQKRYRLLVLEAIDASREAAIREVLLEEARADYERARALTALADATTAEPSTEARTSAGGAATRPMPGIAPDPTQLVTQPSQETTPVKRPSVAVIDDGTQGRWSKALRSKLRVQDVFVLAACLAGIYFTASLIKAPTPRLVSLAAIIAIAAMVAVRALLLYRRPDAVVTWPYPVIALLSAGPAYGFGLHAGFAAIVATVLFSGRLFRTPQQTTNPAIISLWAACLAHGTVFVLVTTGVLPDDSNLPLRMPDFPWYAPFLHHAMVQSTYVVAYLAGGRIDREFVRAYEVAREAFAASVRADARLQVARTELDAALQAEGLFTGTAVGPYKLGRLLGRGGMGEVYQAESPQGRVALKLLRADRLGDPVALARFAREASMLTRIASPFCARVIEVSAEDRAVPYLAMEYVDGPSLSHVLRERARLDHAEVVALVDDLARGLGDVHAAGVVHLDLKPSNVLRDSAHAGRWKIVDFGIARLLTDEAHRKVAGTPPYMAPEQALGEPLDTRTDLYSLSLILYRAITGRPAYVGGDAAVIAHKARTVGPPDPREVVTISDELALVLRIGLAANLADRFADTAELRAAFIAALGGRLDPRLVARGRELLARAPWAPVIALISGRQELGLRSSAQ